MSSILKVDTIQTAAGGTPTAADLGLNVSGSVLQLTELFSDTNVTIAAPADTWTEFTSANFTLKRTDSSVYIPITLTIARVSGNYIRVATRIVVNGVDVSYDRRSNYDQHLRIYDYVTPSTTDIYSYSATYWVPSNYLNVAGVTNTISLQATDGTGSSTSQNIIYVNGSIQEIAG